MGDQKGNSAVGCWPRQLLTGDLQIMELEQRARTDSQQVLAATERAVRAEQDLASANEKIKLLEARAAQGMTTTSAADHQRTPKFVSVPPKQIVPNPNRRSIFLEGSPSLSPPPPTTAVPAVPKQFATVGGQLQAGAGFSEAVSVMSLF